MTALTAMTGALGQTGGTVPLSAALRAYGWTATFLGTAAGSAVLAFVVLRLVRDRPEGTGGRPRVAAPIRADLRAVLAQRGTRAGIWAHFTLMSSFMVLATLWGYPYLVEGLGMAPSAAKLTLTLTAATPLAVAPIMGWVAGHRPGLRGRLIVSVATVLGLTWIMAITWPGGRLPVPLAVALVLVSATGSAASMLAFDLARDANPPERAGIASGVVNVGGFTAAMTASLAAGAILDATGGYDGPAFQRAFIPITCMIVLGTVRVAFLLRPARSEPREPVISPAPTSRARVVHPRADRPRRVSRSARRHRRAYRESARS